VVKDLQNFSRHKHLPIAGQKVCLMYKKSDVVDLDNPSVISFSPPSLLVKELLEDKELSAKTKQFLKAQGYDELVLKTVIDKAHSDLMASTLCLRSKINAL